MARPKALSVAVGPGPPDLIAGGPRRGVGVRQARLDRGDAGAVVDRTDPALRAVADSGCVLRPRWREPARRGDRTPRERQVLPVLHLRGHSLPAGQPGRGVLPVVGRRPELA